MRTERSGAGGMSFARRAPHMRVLRLLVPSAILLMSSSSAAQTQTLAPAPYPPAPTYAAPQPPPPERKVRTASITFSPIHLLMPIAEITGEFAVSDKIGLAGIVGVGSVPLKTTTISSTGRSTESTERLSAWEVGGHFNYYVIGDFDHGMQLGVEALYLKIARSEQNYRSAASANGFAVGPYVGYKLITRVGFTFESNLGFQYVAARAEASDGTTTAEAKSSTVIPLLNLNVGWSF